MSPITAEDVMENAWSEEILEPADAAVQLLDTFRILARMLCPRDRHLQEDLVQEMALSALMDPTPRTLSAYCITGMWRAKNFLRLWYEQTKRPGCERHSRSVEDPLLEEESKAVAERAEAAAVEFKSQNSKVNVG